MPRYTVFEFSESDVKVLHVVKTRKAPTAVEQALRVDFADLGRDDEAQVERASRLREALRRSRIQPGPAAIVLPKQDAIVRTAILPSANAEELVSMGQFEAEKFIQLNADRHIISSMPLHLDEVNGSHVLVAAVDGPVIQSAVALVTALPFEPVIAEVTSMSLVRAFLQAPESAHAEGGEPVADVLLNIGTTQLEMHVVHQGLLLTTRSQPGGVTKLARDLQKAMHLGRALTPADLEGLDLTNPDGFLLDGGSTSESDSEPGRTGVGDKVRAWLQTLLRFVRQTYDFALREHHVPPRSRVFVSGEGIALGGLERVLAQQLHVEVRPFNPLAAVPRTPRATVDESALPGMAAAWGAALRLVEEGDDVERQQGRINLLPAEIIEARVAAERRTMLILSALMVLIMVGMLYMAWAQRQEHAAELAARYKKYNSDMRPLVEQIEAKRQQLAIIDRIKTGRAPALHILDQLSLFPGMGSSLRGGRLVLTEFRYTASDEVVIAGDALSVEDISEFNRYLENMMYKDKPVFRAVGIPANSPRDLSRDRGTIWTFSLTATLNRADGDSRTASRK